jgi:hypothetical protein
MHAFACEIGNQTGDAGREYLRHAHLGSPPRPGGHSFSDDIRVALGGGGIAAEPGDWHAMHASVDMEVRDPSRVLDCRPVGAIRKGERRRKGGALGAESGRWHCAELEAGKEQALPPL